MLHNGKHRYQYSGAEAADLNLLNELKYIANNGRAVSFKTFHRHVDLEDFNILQLNLGYSINSRPGMHISNDPCVKYYKSNLSNCHSVYYMTHASVEYVFFKEASVHNRGRYGPIEK